MTTPELMLMAVKALMVLDGEMMMTVMLIGMEVVLRRRTSRCVLSVSTQVVTGWFTCSSDVVLETKVLFSRRRRLEDKK